MTKRAVPPSYRPPAKPSIHRHGKPTGNAQTDSIDVLGPESHPYGSDVVSRKAGHAHGLAARPGDHRRQESDVNDGKRTDRRAGPYRGNAGTKQK